VKRVAEGQETLPGLDLGRATVVSPSALGTWRLCPRQYRFVYVDGLGKLTRTGPEQAFGLSIHAALRDFFRLPVPRRSLEALLACYRKAFVRDGYASRQARDQARTRGADALTAWYGRRDTEVVPYATELGLQAAFGEVVLKGRLDRLDPDPSGGLVVIDYKTGARAATQERADADEALTIYAALAERRLGRRVTKLVLDYVVAGAEVVTERPEAALRERLDVVLEAAGALHADREFAPRPGPWCVSCDFLRRCPEGRRHVAEQQDGGGAIQLD
jgi:putative RecB family exonuclease